MFATIKRLYPNELLGTIEIADVPTPTNFGFNLVAI